MARVWIVLLVLSLSLLISCASAPQDPAATRLIQTPAEPGSGQPHLTVGDDGQLYLSWVEPLAGGGHRLRFAVRDGSAWAAPKTIASGVGWFVNWADFPSLAATADGVLAAHWLVKSGGPTYAYDVRLSTSRDGGASWSAPVTAHGDGTATEHGFVSIVPAATGFGLVWLDGRRTADEPAGPMTLRFTELSRDGAVDPDSLVDESVCDCCPTDAVRLDDGSLLVAYRDRTDEEIRDVYVSRMESGRWSRPIAVNDDGWKIEGCPVNGPALASRGDAVVVAWFTMPGDASGMVQVAFSQNGGRSFGPPLRIDDGDPHGRVDVAWVDGDAALVSWIEQRGDGGSLELRRVDLSGRLDEPRSVTPISTSRASGIPQLAFHDGAAVLAWTETGDPSTVRTAIVR